MSEAFDPATHAADTLTGDYTIDPAHTRLGFSARHAMVTTVRGTFETFTGTAHIDESDPSQSKVELDIDMASISTGNADRDGHLRSADFFDTDKDPKMTFSSTEVSHDGDDWTVTGDLAFNGASNPVTIVFEHTGSARDPFGNLRAGFEGSTSISRKDWGVTFNAALETGGVLVSDKIKLEFDVSAIRNA